MPGPRIDELYKYSTIPKAAERLGLHPAKLRRRLKAGVLPPPTYVNRYGLRFFNEDWIRQAQAILDSSFERQNIVQRKNAIANKERQMRPDLILNSTNLIKKESKE